MSTIRGREVTVGGEATFEQLKYQGIYVPRRFSEQGMARGQESVEQAKRPPALGATFEQVAQTLTVNPRMLERDVQAGEQAAQQPGGGLPPAGQA